MYLALSILCLLFVFSDTFDINLATSKRNIDSMGPATNFTLNPFVVLIISGGVNNTILSGCTGSILNTKSMNFDNHNATFILTTSYCILNRQDPGNTTRDLLYKVLVEDPISGTIPLAGTKFSVFEPMLRILHPLAGTIQNYSVDITTPPGPTTTPQNISVNINDIGLIRLDKLIDIPTVSAVTVDYSTNILPPGTPVSLLGYGAPDFLHLHNTTRLQTVRAINNANGLPSNDMLFFHDSIANLPSTTASTPHQAVEVADEGGPILNGAGHQIAIGQATWRVMLPDNSTILTYASLGPRIGFYKQYISDTLAVFIPAGSTPTTTNNNGSSTNRTTPPSLGNNTNQTNTTNTQSYGSRIVVNGLFLLVPLLSFLML